MCDMRGFGHVGFNFGQIAREVLAELLLTAASDSSGGVSSAFGLDAQELAEYKAGGGKLTAYVGDDTVTISNDQLLSEEVDVLVLAALGDVVTDKNVKQVKARFVLELANGPVSDAAYQQLSSDGVVVIPDVLANAGGVIVSYLEWLQNRAGEHWSEAKVHEKMEHYLVPAVTESLKLGDQKNLTLKEAALARAAQGILK